MGSDERLYPKVVLKGGTTTGESAMNTGLHEVADVITLGDSFEQNLYVSGDDNASGTGGFSIMNFVYSKDRNPLIAELPNLKIYHASGSGNTNTYGIPPVQYYVKTDITDNDEVVLTTDNDGGTGALSLANDVLNGYAINASNLRVSGNDKTITVLDYVGASDTVT